MFKSKVSINKFFNILNLFFLILPLLLLSGCTMLTMPPNTSLYSGSIQVYSDPAGAAIYLDGSDTGYTSPKLLNNIYPGSHLITFKLEGYLNSNNFVQVYPNQTTPLNVTLTPNPYLNLPDTKNLLRIEVQPETLSLFSGEVAHIDSIIAYYSDNSYQNISANQCSMYSTNPDVAYINLVGQIGQITALSKGQTTIWISYSETGITKSDSILVIVDEFNQNLGNLININVLPDTMTLDIGESKSISLITAYYDSGLEQSISPEQCDFYVNNSFVSINNYGVITGNSPGTSIITASYTEGGISKSDTLTVTVNQTFANQPTYRALAIGIGDYIYYGEEGDLLAPPYDVNKMAEILEDCRFNVNQTSFQKISTLKDQQATKQNIINKIQSTFSGADENDVSYFYFSGHGALVNQVSYLCPADFNGQISSAISVDELESDLSAVAGTKVVFIDSCNSGGFIGKSTLETEEFKNTEYLTQFNDGIISAFANHILSKDLLTSAEYQVLTSSHWYEESYEIDPADGEPFGVFTQGLYEGCSLDNNTPADINQNDKISLSEAYNFIYQWVAAMRVNQNVQVYPVNSSFTIFEY